MVHWHKNLISALVLSIFVFLALASVPDPNSEPWNLHCQHIGTLWECDPLVPPVYHNKIITLTVLDQSTQQPIEGIYVKLYWNEMILHNIQCGNKCYGDMFFSSHADREEYTTDASGQIYYTYSDYQYNDTKDVMSINFQIIDFSGKYSGRTIHTRLNYTQPTLNKTVYLLNQNEL